MSRNKKNSVRDSFSVEKKHVDPAWSAENHGIKISNYAVAELFPEKPVYKTNTGVEIASWELPNLPDAYLDEISWPQNTPKYQVADLGLSLVKGRYYQTVNRADAQYIHNTVTGGGYSLLVSLLDTAPNAAVHTYPTVLVTPKEIFLSTLTSGTTKNTVVGDLTGEVALAFTEASTVTNTESLTLTNAVNEIAWITTFPSETSAYNGTWGSTGLCSGDPTDRIYNVIEFASDIPKGTDDTLKVTITWTFGT